MSTPSIADFLLARIAEDEQAARTASPGGWTFGTVESVAGGSLYDDTRMIGAMHYEQPDDHDGSIVRHLLSDEANANGEHIARHAPARVLAECEAKRAIVEAHELDADVLAGSAAGTTYGFGCATCHYEARHGSVLDCGPCSTLLALASVYADHRDYRDEWRADLA